MDNAPVPAPAPHVVVIGGGIAGLAAAYHLVTDATAGRVPRVTVLEGSPRLGGRLSVSPVAGVPVDEGAEAMLARRDEGVELARAVGLGDRLMHPGTAKAAILSRGGLRPIPAGQVQGVPGDMAALAASGVLSADGVARAERERDLPAPPLEADTTVAGYLAGRFGGEVVDRLVEPLLGGVYAGRADVLSLAATLPPIYAAARSGGPLTDAVAAITARAAEAARESGPRPVFAGLAGGLGTLPEAVARAAASRGVQVRTTAMVRELARDEPGGGWRLTLGSAHAPELLRADAVVIAVPGRPAARLLRPVVPAAATELAGIEYASMAIVTLAYPADAFARPPSGSGYLVPAVERTGGQAFDRPVKAVTFTTTKWPQVAAGSPDAPVIVRCSIGRHGEERLLQRDDAELVAAAGAELARTSGLHGEPIDARVTRWGGGLPQYALGHLDRVTRLRAAVAAVGHLAVCGAAYDGVGVPACIASARRAATLIAEGLTPARQ